jgi:hypothetical protein
MELILGIPPMSQYDAAATPMFRCFNATASQTGFNSRPITVDLNDKNTARSKWQKKSEKFDLSKEDAAPDLEFNMVLWHGIKGDDIPFPAPKRAAFLKVGEDKDDDD